MSVIREIVVNPRILFVDDEANLLHGLQRMLRSQRHSWDMEFAQGGEEALRAISERSFDIIITDMRMPEMDGAALLQKVSERSPSTVRMILSGQADEGAIFRVVKHAHLYLSKPCHTQAITDAVSRACETRELIGSRVIVEFVSRIGSMFCLPEHHRLLKNALQSPYAATQAIADTIAMDIGMTAKILHIANSSFFGNGPAVSDPWVAVARLGLDTLRELISSTEIFTPSDLDPGILSLPEVTEYSCLVASLAHEMATRRGVSKEYVQQAYTAGLLHQIGRIILAQAFPKEFRGAQLLAERKHISQVEAERLVFGTSHAEVGGYLLALWGLPQSLVDTVREFQNPLPPELRQTPLLSLLELATQLVSGEGGMRQ